MRLARLASSTIAMALLLASPAHATFHLMQIQEVIGGVNGDTKFQAIQLRMRALGQNLVSNGLLRAWDATGTNSVLLISFPTNVAVGTTGSTVLAATANFGSLLSPAVTPDFTLTRAIPDSDLAAGSLTYEDKFGDVLWRLSWGGAAYTGPTNGDLTNDLDGEFGPPWPGPLPSTSTSSLLFQGAATALSTNNAADYAVTAGPATFTNNAGASGSLTNLLAVTPTDPKGGPVLLAPSPNPVAASLAYAIELPHESRVQVRVLDPGGRVVSTLVDQTLEPGRHSFSWSAPAHGSASLPNGIYFLELNALGVRQARTFVVIR